MTKQKGKMSFGARSVEIMAETRIIGVVIDFTGEQKERYDLLQWGGDIYAKKNISN